MSVFMLFHYLLEDSLSRNQFSALWLMFMYHFSLCALHAKLTGRQVKDATGCCTGSSRNNTGTLRGGGRESGKQVAHSRTKHTQDDDELFSLVRGGLCVFCCFSSIVVGRS